VASSDSKEVDLQDLNPEFQRRLGNFLTSAKAAGIPAHIIEAYRSNEVQAQYYREKQQGLRPYPVAPPGASFHNYGYASDVLADDRASQQKLIDYANAHPEFGVSPLPGDAPHFQIAGYKHVADLLKNPPAYQGGTGAADLSPFIAGNQGYSIAKGYTPYNPGTMVAGPGAPSGTTINAANTPVPGALTKPEAGPENVSSSAPTATSSGPQDPRQIVFNKLVAAGLSPQAALGSLWSLGGEGGKGLDPRSYNAKDPGGSIGYGQWNRERRTALENLAKANGTAWSDPNTQADHIINELTNKDYATYQPGVFDKLKAATTPEEAAKIWTGGFERPLKDNSDQRIKGGPQVATLDDNGNLVLGSATGGGSAPASAAPAVASSATPAPTDDRPWYAKAFGSLMEGKEGKKSPFEQFSDAMVGSGPKEQKAAMEAQAPEKSALTAQGPGARNVSPGLQNVAQTYGQTLNSFSQPLTWNSAPPQAPMMPAAGLQPMPAPQVPGVSLTSVQPLPQGIGYGINPVGYGFG
jgi:hypothetical protein